MHNDQRDKISDKSNAADEGSRENNWIEASDADAGKGNDGSGNAERDDGERRLQVTTTPSSDDSDNRGDVSPAHWQGEPLPDGHDKQTQEVGFDQRGAGRASQYGRAGDYGERHQKQERRPPRGETRPDKDLLDAVHDAYQDSRLDIGAVKVIVDKGVVHLSGHVARDDDKYALERLAANCPGTIAVQNQIEVGDSPDDSIA